MHINPHKMVLVKFRDGQERWFKEPPSRTIVARWRWEGLFFHKTEKNQKTIISSCAVLYLRQYTGCSLFAFGNKALYFKTKIELSRYVTMKIAHASKATSHDGYWVVSDHDEGYMYIFPCSAVITIVEKGPYTARLKKIK